MTDAPRKLLVVDDQPDVCWALQRVLSLHGIDSEAAASAGEALEKMRRERFPVVFVDAKLPRMDGMELAEKLRSLDRDVFIVMVSGYYYEDDREVRSALEEGRIQAFLAKPFDNETVVKVVRKAGVK